MLSPLHAAANTRAVRPGTLSTRSLALVAGLAMLSGCEQAGSSSTPGTPAASETPKTTETGTEIGTETGTETGAADIEGRGQDRYVIGLIPKSAGNPVFIAARSGAEAAALEIFEEHGVEIEISWRAPLKESSSRQIEIIDEMTMQGVDGIAISCTDPTLATPAINRAVASGAEVVTFDSDAPGSDRIGYFGIDDQAAGQMIMAELAERMPEGGRVAVLAGNRAAENIRNRVIGVADEANEHESITLVGAFDHDETPLGAGDAMAKAHENYTPIDGWVLVGGWPLYHPDGLNGVPDGTPIVSIDVLPQTIDALEAGRVQALLGQPYYDWGHETVRMLFDRLHMGKAPSPAAQNADLEIVTGDNSAAFRERWVGWVGTSAAESMAIQPSMSEESEDEAGL